MLNLKRLEHLVVIAQEHSFLKAAQRLHLTPPALTRSIQTLESTLGLVLLNRSHEGVSLTEAGQLVVQRANRLLGDAQNLKNEADQLRGVQTGQVNFGVGVFPAAAFLSGVLIHRPASVLALKFRWTLAAGKGCWANSNATSSILWLP
jgi:DNA-binding transcriptional LysR family regulator